MNDIDEKGRELAAWIGTHLLELKAAALEGFEGLGPGVLVVVEDFQHGGYCPLGDILNDDIKQSVVEYKPPTECVIAFPLEKGVLHYTLTECGVIKKTVQ